MNDENLYEQFVALLCFRKLLGLGDIARRNFMVKNGTVYSYDEESYTTKPLNVKALKLQPWSAAMGNRLQGRLQFLLHSCLNAVCLLLQDEQLSNMFYDQLKCLCASNNLYETLTN
jgi:hypothetical protein